MKQIRFTQTIPNTDSRSFKDFYKDTLKFKLLTRDEERELLKLANVGNEEAINKLIECNLRLVILIAMQFQTYDYLEDLVQVGVLGLHKAITNYDDPTYNLRFNTYATKKIQGEILQYLRDFETGIHTTFYQTYKASKIQQFINDYEKEHEFPPNNDVICAEFNLTPEQLHNAMNSVHLRMESEIDSDGNSIIDQYKYSEMQIEEHSDCVLKIKELLTPFEFDLLADAFGLNTEELTTNQLSEKYHLTQERIRFVINAIILKLRKHPELLEYLNG